MLGGVAEWLILGLCGGVLYEVTHFKAVFSAYL